MAVIYAGIQILEKAFEFCSLENINLESDVHYLKMEISKKINFSPNEMELIYDGNKLEDTNTLKEIRPNSIVHVFKKRNKYIPYVSTKIYTKEDCKKIAKQFGTVTHTQINVNVRINILHRIISEYPEFRRNLSAQAILRDSILFHTLDKVDVIERIAEKHPIICDAADFIIKTTKKELARNEIYIVEESFSDSTTSSEEENSPPVTQSEQGRAIRRISRNQLEAALIRAGNSSVNSLSNIAHSQQNPSDLQPSNSSARISNRALTNALAQAMGQMTRSVSTNPPTEMTTTTETEPVPPVNRIEASANSYAIANDSEDLPEQYRDHQYNNEMRTMRQMGLTNDAVNLNVLIITNGNLENAINLVLGTPGLENDFC